MQVIDKNFYINEIRIGKSKIASIVLALLKLRRLRDGDFESTEIDFSVLKLFIWYSSFD
jgi:hypothetical protein